MTKHAFINNPLHAVSIPTDTDLTYYSDSFLSSCFKYYYGKIQLVNKSLNQKVQLQISESFLSVKNTGTLIIIDYPNVMYTLHEKYKNRNAVIKHFYNFIKRHLLNKCRFFIVSKQVIIGDNNYNIENVFNIGQQLTKNKINSSYFLNESICVFNINYKKKVSSSTDDLLSWFICVNLFAYLLKSKQNPTAKQMGLKKLTFLTNDKQLFDKNLFGLTESEKKQHINILKDLSLSKLILNGVYYEMVKDLYNSSLVIHFLSKYVIANVNDTENIECNITVLLESLMNPTHKKTAKLYGYYRQNKWPEYNPNFKKHNFTKKQMLNFSYHNLNKKQKLLTQNSQLTSCKLNKMRNNNNGLKEYYYLYVFIKYVQLFLNTTNYDNQQYGDFFGSYSKYQIIKIIS